MSSVTNHPLYIKTVQSLERTVVRDKLMRLVQYFSRFLTYWAYRKGYSKSSLVRIKALQTHLGMSRKIMRSGKFLGNIRAFVAELANKTGDPVLHVTNLGKDLGMAAFLFFDTLQWLQATGVKRFSPEWLTIINQTGSRGWLLSLVSSFIQAAYILYRSDAKERALTQEPEKDAAAIKKVEAEKAKAKYLLLWHALDMTIPASTLGLVNLDDGIVGLAGAITAWFGLKAALK